MRTLKSQNSSYFAQGTLDNSYLPIKTLKTLSFHRNNRKAQKFNSSISRKIENHLRIKAQKFSRRSNTHLVISNTSFYSLLFTHCACKTQNFLAHTNLEVFLCF